MCSILGIMSQTLDFLKIDPDKDLEQQFDRIANELLIKYYLFTSSQPYQLTEIEFYYYGKKHEDVFCHRNERQNRFGEWYLHRKSQGADSALNQNKYECLDLTFGDGAAFGGILIRGMVSMLDPERYFDGPNLVVSELKRRFGAATVEEFQAKLPESAFDSRPGCPIYLGMNEPFHKVARIHKGSRVNINLSSYKSPPELKMPFWAKAYRYHADVSRTDKELNALFLNAHLNRDTSGFNAILSRKLRFNYLRSYHEGQTRPFSGFIGRKLGVREKCEALGSAHVQYRVVSSKEQSAVLPSGFFHFFSKKNSERLLPSREISRKWASYFWSSEDPVSQSANKRQKALFRIDTEDGFSTLSLLGKVGDVLVNSTRVGARAEYILRHMDVIEWGDFKMLYSKSARYEPEKVRKRIRVRDINGCLEAHWSYEEFREHYLFASADQQVSDEYFASFLTMRFSYLVFEVVYDDRLEEEDLRLSEI